MGAWVLLVGLTLLVVPAELNVFNDFSKGITKEIVAVKVPIEDTIVYVGSSQCSNVKKIVGIAYDQIEGEKEPDLNQLALEYRDPTIRVVYNLSTAAERLARAYNPQQKLVIFIHGFTDDPSKASFSNISDALLRKGESNVLALDGSALIHWLYLRSTTYVQFMGQRLAEVLAAMVARGLNPAAIHIIGHSLGAHISGFTGKTFTALTGKKIGRISGLDPAGPCFTHVLPELKLSPNDADYVDVIHTDGGVYGLKEPVGHADYYPNNGEQQPNCLFQTCSHSRAWLYYTESVINPTAFPAARCASWDAFKKGACDDFISYMGYPSVPGTQGLFFLQTNDESPFGLGLEGRIYKDNEAYVKKIGDSAKALLFG